MSEPSEADANRWQALGLYFLTATEQEVPELPPRFETRDELQAALREFLGAQ